MASRKHLGTVTIQTKANGNCPEVIHRIVAYSSFLATFWQGGFSGRTPRWLPDGACFAKARRWEGVAATSDVNKAIASGLQPQ